jgi:predicted flap endonuclease-1-like 5' DNA nuclease
MSHKIADIEGIGPSLSETLANAGVKTVEALLAQGASSSGRADIARRSGLDEGRILKWVNMADLYRVRGIGSEYAELLEAAGVDTVRELATRNADNLHAKILEVNAQRNLVRKAPTLEQVRKFVAHAETLKPMVQY